MGGYYEVGTRWLICSANMVNRGDNGRDKPWMGFRYGSWLPRVSVWWGQRYRSLSWRWLCFYGEIGVGK